MKNENFQGGITLIALVVTIIVLIILAGVSIAMLVGENGIITQAQRAERETTNATITSEEHMNALVDEMNGYLAGNGEVSGIFSDMVTSSNYGDYVDYPIDLNNNGNTKDDWRIFYNDSEHVFIIAADYVESNIVNIEATEMYKVANDSGYSNYKYSLNWYNGSNSTLINAGHSSIKTEVADLFMYNKYLTQNSSSAYINAQATAAMLNTSAWNNFKDSNGYSEYVVGGPTLEMWVESYNAKEYMPLYTNINNIGYYIGNEEGTTDYYYDVTADSNNGYEDTLYFLPPNAENKCYGYWLPSPSVGGNSYIMHVGCNGRIDGDSYDDVSVSVRPLVCLKSKVVSIQENDIWKISI